MTGSSPRLGPEELEAEHETEHLGEIPGCPACRSARHALRATFATATYREAEPSAIQGAASHQ